MFMDKERLGFIGLGTMGMPMSLNLLKSGNNLSIWGRDKNKLEDAIKAGAKLLENPKVMAANCDVIFLCVFDAEAVEEIVFGPNGISEGAHDNLLIVDHSSIHPEKAREIANKLNSSSGANWVDCPVSGGKYGARDGLLVMMAGGSDQDIERLKPLVEPTSQRLTHMGPIGCGQALNW
jgi:3-hydroxyisobutyrate dehydrogenase and related beta-hydroxyacid dehydrogenases